MLRKIGLLLATLSLLAVGVPARAAPLGVPTDRWLEMDLYWFDPAGVDRSADVFWNRYAPLFRGVTGYKGVVLNVGMTVNYVMTFNGDLSQEIVLPKGLGQEIGHVVRGQLDGDTAQRQAAWRARFRGPPAAAETVGYGRWRYGDLRRLADALRARATRDGIAGFRVASLVVGSDGAYGEPAPFATRHPEAWTPWREQAAGAISSSSHFDPAAVLHADPTRLAGLPQGIREGLPVHAAFAAQWGALSKAVGLDGIMLRDSFSFPRAYTRYGPYGPLVPDAATAERTTAGLAALIRESKQANPHALIMMYSTAATATSDWRANGVDLERIAREGFVDIFVDQTWGGAWGEVGVREQTFWNAPIVGWTYQLGYLLEHAAVLADARVRHYPLIETFDAWESWDTIHTAPDRLRWAIWAFGHAGVKTPHGLRMPEGTYISWGNHGHDLLSEADVTFLSREMNAAARDAAQTTDIAGPTVVYSRAAMAAQLARLAPGFDVRDQIDEQVGSIVKWPLPILSATRAEWLPQVRSDLFLFGATEGMPADQLATITAMARQGRPMAFFGAAAGATDGELARLLDVRSSPHAPAQEDLLLQATLGPAAEALALSGVPRSFSAPPTATRVSAPTESTVYAFGDSAGLVITPDGPTNLALWDPPTLDDTWYIPLRDIMHGDPSPYALASATLNRQLTRVGAFSASLTDIRQTGTVAAWSLADGTHRVLAGNLEEGLRDDGDRARDLRVHIPIAWGACRDAGDPRARPLPVSSKGDMDILLPPEESRSLRCSKERP